MYAVSCVSSGPAVDAPSQPKMIYRTVVATGLALTNPGVLKHPSGASLAACGLHEAPIRVIWYQSV